MRTEIPGALPLFRSELQVRLLALLILQSERSWTLTELADTLDAPVSSTHRELRRIETAGLLTSDQSMRPYRFTGASDSPLFQPLHDLLQRTVGVERELHEALSADGIIAAAIHGSWAGGERRPDSDIDVVVVGEIDLRDLRKRTRVAAGHAGRRIDLTLFKADEIKDLASNRRGFARHLLDDPIVPLVGDIRELMRT